MFLEPSAEGLVAPVKEFQFAVVAKSSNPEAGGNDADNMKILTVPIEVETDTVSLSGISTPSQVEVNTSSIDVDISTLGSEAELGEQVEHVYQIINKGRNEITESEVTILWPSYNEEKQHLLYLLEFTQEANKGRVTCNAVPDLDPLNILVSLYFR